MDENYSMTSMNESIEQFGLRFRIKKNRHLASLRSARINELQVEHFLLASNVSNKAKRVVQPTKSGKHKVHRGKKGCFTACH